MYENNIYTLHKKFPGWPFLQHEGQVHVLLTSAYVDVAIVPGAGSVVEGEARPEQAAQHHQGIAPLHLDAPGPWGGGEAWVPWSQNTVGCAEAPALWQPGPGA